MEKEKEMFLESKLFLQLQLLHTINPRSSHLQP